MTGDRPGLAGRGAIVTGASGGIGRATAVAPARGRPPRGPIERDADALAATRAEIENLGRQAVPPARDVSDPAGVEAAARGLAAPGLCDTPVNAAGLLRPGPLDGLPFFLRPAGCDVTPSPAIPTARIGRSEDIADVVPFLASPRSAYVNGDEVMVDGAFTRDVVGFIPRAGHEAPAGPAH